MIRRRRLWLAGLGVTALLVVAGIASHGRPLSPGRGGGPTPTFFDYVYTTFALAFLGMTAIALYSMLSMRLQRTTPGRQRWHLLNSLLTLAASAAIAWFLLRHGLLERLQRLEQGHAPKQPAQAGQGQVPPGGKGRDARVRWDEVLLVVALLGGALAFTLATRRTRPAARPWRLRSHEAVSLALDESLDDLREEPDLRRAIIAAYARMERALARAGTQRLPAEAPLEYLERALHELDLSPGAVRRLTDLFEWAKFSHHEPEPQMRDEAIEALVAVRDELRRPAEAAVA